MKTTLLSFAALMSLLMACGNKQQQPVIQNTGPADTAYVYLTDYDTTFVLDLKYATDDNFLHRAVYPCAECKLAYETVRGLIKAQQYFRQRGYRLKLFDCYRPRSVQYKMWEILPDDRYVANPAGKGSAHNRGLAVDLTLVTDDGRELDMGTGFDHFGEEAHHDYTNLPDTVLQNRQLLKKGMEAAGFDPYPTEWWHYTYRSSHEYEPADDPLCRQHTN